MSSPIRAAAANNCSSPTTIPSGSQKAESQNSSATTGVRVVGFAPLIPLPASPNQPPRTSSGSSQNASCAAADDALFRNLYITSDFCGLNELGQPGWSTFCTDMLRSGPSLDVKDNPIIDARIVETATKVVEDGTKIQQYLIEVEHENFRSRIWHRYSDFRRLRKRLVDRYGEEVVPSIPGKQYNKFSERVILHRMEKLNNFLQNVMLSQLLRESEEVKSFLRLEDELEQPF